MFHIHGTIYYKYPKSLFPCSMNTGKTKTHAIADTENNADHPFCSLLLYILYMCNNFRVYNRLRIVCTSIACMLIEYYTSMCILCFRDKTKLYDMDKCKLDFFINIFYVCQGANANERLGYLILT